MAEKKTSLRYVGQRMLGDDKLHFAFQKSNGELVFFSGMKWLIIGRAYFGTKGGDQISRRPDEDESAVQPSEDDMRTWEVADTLARDLQRRKRLSAKMNKSPPELERAVNAIRPLIKGLDFGQRRQLIEILFSKASKGKDGWVE